MVQAEALGLHVASLVEGPLRLGRCRESDVEIRDDYISRRHALIRFEGGQFLLEDNNSKWGTLVPLREPWRLSPRHSMHLQVGPVLLRLSLRLQPLDPHSLQLQLLSGLGTPLRWPPGLFDVRVRALWLSALGPALPPR